MRTRGLCLGAMVVVADIDDAVRNGVDYSRVAGLATTVARDNETAGSFNRILALDDAATNAPGSSLEHWSNSASF